MFYLYLWTQNTKKVKIRPKIGILKITVKLTKSIYLPTT